MKQLRIFLMRQLGFSRVESNGVFVLSILVLIMAVLPRLLIRYWELNPKLESNIDASWIKKIESKDNESNNKSKSTTETPVVNKILTFDPNEATVKQWQNIGFTNDQAMRAVKYSKSGGKFYSINDVKKIYGVTVQQVQRVEEFLVFPEETTDIVRKDYFISKSLNSATPRDFEEIRGIGEKLSQRIVKYRDLLGGFYSFDQLRDVYGLPDSLLPSLSIKFFIDTLSIRKIDINTLPTDSIWKHPYLENYQVKAINQYRLQHGLLGSLDDLQKIKILPDSTIQILAPYIEF